MRRLLSVFALTLCLSAPAWAVPGEQPVEPVKKAKKAKIKTGIQWHVLPGTVEVYVDAKKVGMAQDLTMTTTKPGRHTIRLVNGEDETEFDVMVKKGQVVQLNYEFTDG